MDGSMADERGVVIVGAGLAGALLASMLARRGWRVTVVERREDPRATGFVGGRSINLALSARGIDALSRVGLSERVLLDAIPMPGRMIHSRTGGLAFQPYSRRASDAINSVSRGGLNLTLIQAADEHENVTLRFGTRCIDVDPDGPAILVETADGARERIEGAVVIGADGAYSAVRQWMQRHEGFDYSQHYLSHGYKELHIPPAKAANAPADANEGFAMLPRALHIWPRGGSMMIALPNKDQSFTCTVFWPFAGEHSFEACGREGVRAFFSRHYPDAISLMPSLEEDFAANPIGSLVTIRCRPWRQGRVVLLGDAAHAVVPFYGQGMNAAFEDCVALAARLEPTADVEEALLGYTQDRLPHAEAIADMALANFVEMRDRVASRTFRAWKKTEKLLHGMLGGWFVPLYNLVSFSTVPYADARRQARRKLAILGLVAGLLGLAAVLSLCWALGGIAIWLAGGVWVSALIAGLVGLALRFSQSRPRVS